MQKVFITGAHGNIGRPLIKKLRERGIDFRAGTRNPEHDFETMMDYANPADMEKAFAGSDVLFLLMPDHPDNLQWVRNALRAASAAGIRHVVRSSGIGASPESPYAILRLLGEIEQEVKTSDIPWTILRPNSFMDNFAIHEAGMIRAGNLYSSRGEARVSFVSLEDIAEAAAAVLENPEPHAGRALTLTGPEALTMGECVEKIAAAADIACSVVPVDDEAVRAGLTESGMPAWHADMLLSLYEADREGLTSAVSEDGPDLLGRQAESFARFTKRNRTAWLKPR